MSAYFAKEDILKVLSKHDLWFSYISPDSWHELKEQIKALPTVELKPIVIDGEEYLTGADYNAYLKGYKDGKAKPTKHGRWIRKESKRSYWFECSECGYPPPLDKFKRERFSNYCPNCGAIMGGEEND